MRWIFRLAGLLLVLVFMGAVALLLIPTDRIKVLAADQFQAATGRTITFRGDLRPALFPVIGVRADGIAISNAEWSASGPMVEAESLLIGIAPIPLLSGEVDIRQLRIDRPVIRLEVSRSGARNWDLGGNTPSASTGGTGGGLPTFALADARITRGDFFYSDATSGTKLALEGIDLKASIPARGPTEASFSARLNGETAHGDVQLDDLAGFLAGRTVDVKLDAEIGGATVGFNGVVGNGGGQVQGSLVADASSIDRLMRGLGQAGPGLPGAWDALSARAEVTMKDASLAVRGLSATAGGTDVSGDIDVALSGERPRIVGRITTGRLDLRPFTQGDGDSGGSSTGWPRDPIDASALSAADADLALSTGGLALGFADIGATSLRATVEAGRAVVTLDRAGFYGGNIAGAFVANARGGLSVSADTVAAGIQLQPFLKQFADYDRLAGSGTIAVKLLGSGGSMDAIMRSLKGSASIDIGQGEILGFDLAGMIRNFDTSFRGSSNKTIYDSIKANFAVAGGVASNDDLRFRSPVMDVAGKGRVDLGGQTVDYTLTPTRFDAEGNSTGNILVPVRVHGPWSSLSYTPDIENALRAGIEGELGKVEEQVRTQVQERINEEIGKAVGGDGTKSPEEAVQDKVRETIENELGKALGGILQQ